MRNSHARKGDTSRDDGTDPRAHVTSTLGTNVPRCDPFLRVQLLGIISDIAAGPTL